MAIITDEEQARFWARVEKTDQCWYWLQRRRWSSQQILERAPGYGTFVTGGKSYTAHKLSYLITHGDIAKGLKEIK